MWERYLHAHVGRAMCMHIDLLTCLSPLDSIALFLRLARRPPVLRSELQILVFIIGPRHPLASFALSYILFSSRRSHEEE